MRGPRLVAAALPALSPTAPALARGVEAGADLRVTQTFGAGEVTLVIAGVSQAPAPLRVNAQAVHPMNLKPELRSLTDGSTSTRSVSHHAGVTGKEHQSRDGGGE